MFGNLYRIKLWSFAYFGSLRIGSGFIYCTSLRWHNFEGKAFFLRAHSLNTAQKQGLQNVQSQTVIFERGIEANTFIVTKKKRRKKKKKKNPNPNPNSIVLFISAPVLLPGFQGKNCSEDVLECSVANPCQNGATCIEEVGSYSCECVDGFVGLNCESMDPCVDIPCENGATCVLLDEETLDFRCDCASGFTGERCVTAVSVKESQSMHFEQNWNIVYDHCIILIQKWPLHKCW